MHRGTHLRSSVGTSILYTFITVNVNHTESWTQSNKIAVKGAGVPHCGVAGRCAWPQTWEGPRTSDIRQYATRQHNRRSGELYPKRLTVASLDSVGPNNMHAWHQPAVVATSWALRGFFFFWCGIHTASVPSAAETHTGGGAVLGKPEGSPARRYSRKRDLK